jgi:hypothetical protein
MNRWQQERATDRRRDKLSNDINGGILPKGYRLQGRVAQRLPSDGFMRNECCTERNMAPDRAFLARAKTSPGLVVLCPKNDLSFPLRAIGAIPWPRTFPCGGGVSRSPLRAHTLAATSRETQEYLTRRTSLAYLIVIPIKT